MSEEKSGSKARWCEVGSARAVREGWREEEGRVTLHIYPNTFTSASVLFLPGQC